MWGWRLGFRRPEACKGGLVRLLESVRFGIRSFLLSPCRKGEQSHRFLCSPIFCRPLAQSATSSTPTGGSSPYLYPYLCDSIAHRLCSSHGDAETRRRHRKNSALHYGLRKPDDPQCQFRTPRASGRRKNVHHRPNLDTLFLRRFSLCVSVSPCEKATLQ